MSSSDSLFQADNQDENPSYFTYEARLKAIRKPQRGSDRFLENHQVEVRLTKPLIISADCIAFRTGKTQERPSAFIQVCTFLCCAIFTNLRQPGDIVKILEGLDLRKKEEDEAFQKVSGPAIPTKLSSDEMEVVSVHTDHIP